MENRVKALEAKIATLESDMRAFRDRVDEYQTYKDPNSNRVAISKLWESVEGLQNSIGQLKPNKIIGDTRNPNEMTFTDAFKAEIDRYLDENIEKVLRDKPKRKYTKKVK